MEGSWYPVDGSEAQNIIRAAEAPPDSPFRPRFRRRSGEIVVTPGLGGGGASGTIAPPSGLAINHSAATSSSRNGLGVLLGKQPIAEALSRLLTLRDVFKMGSSCRALMRRLLIAGGPAPGQPSQEAVGVLQQQGLGLPLSALQAVGGEAIGAGGPPAGSAAGGDGGGGGGGGDAAAGAAVGTG
eukprot:jgi/Undpi1/944/HiC_scaffold_10.g04408.m1